MLVFDPNAQINCLLKLIMYALSQSEAYKVVLPIVFSIQLITAMFSAILLIRRRNIYPIKQLSPRLTLLISVSIIITSGILLVCRLTEIHRTNSATLATMSILYVFFREFIIIAFYMRCLRICAAYFKTESVVIVAIFSRQTLIALVTATISLVPALVQMIQFIITQDVNHMTNFFPFYVVDGEAKILDFFPLWVLDNALFFIVLILSSKVHERFKFIKSLLFACLLFHIEQWYHFIGMFWSQKYEVIRQNFQYVVMCIHTLFLWLLLNPSLRPNQYQHPLPLESILSNPNTALLDRETFFIMSQFAEKLQLRSMTSEERRREASTWLLIYTKFKITQRKIAEIQLRPNRNEDQEAYDGEQIRQLLYNYVQEQIVPNLKMVFIKESVGELFQQGQVMSEQTVREDLQIEHFRKLNRKLDDSISHIFREWKRTRSCEELREQLRQNSKIITTMTKLKIGI